MVYNVSPIIFYKNGKVKIYEQFKNNVNSSMESDFFKTLQNKGIYSREAELANGNGTFIFNTELGRFSVLICFDLTDSDLKYRLNSKIDFAIVICWETKKESVASRCDNVAREEIRSGLVYVNNGLLGGLGYMVLSVRPLRIPQENHCRRLLQIMKILNICL